MFLINTNQYRNVNAAIFNVPILQAQLEGMEINIITYKFY
jgi:hypothetical protein